MEKFQITEDEKRKDISFGEMLESLPIVSCGGSGGHINFAKSGKRKDRMVIRNPFVSYTEKENVSEEEKARLESFRGNIRELVSKINHKLGGDVVKVEVESESFGKSRPTAHTIRFCISENISTIEKAQLVFRVIRDEFGNYLKNISHRSKS